MDVSIAARLILREKTHDSIVYSTYSSDASVMIRAVK